MIAPIIPGVTDEGIAELQAKLPKLKDVTK